MADEKLLKRNIRRKEGFCQTDLAGFLLKTNQVSNITGGMVDNEELD